MNDKRIIKNIGVLTLMKGIGMLLGFVYTPLVLAFLGEARYGVWAVILNIVSWINYFDVGIGSSLRNKLAEAYTLKDENAAKAYVSTAYLGITIVSALFFVVVTLVWECFGLTAFFKMNIEGENVDVSVICSVMFICINFVLSLSRNEAYALQQPGIISVVGVGAQLLQITAVLVMSLFFRESILAVAVMYGIVSIFENLLLQFVITRGRDWLKPSLNAVDMRMMKSLLTLGLGFFITQISALIVDTTDNLLISNLFGSAAVTPYSIVYKCFHLIAEVHYVMFLPMWSAYTEAAVRKDINWIKRTLKRVNLVTALFAFGCAVGIFLFEPFAALWLHKRLEYGMLLIVITALYTISQIFANNFSALLLGVGAIKVSATVCVICALINIPLSVFFAGVCGMGNSGVILGSLCVMLINLAVLPVAVLVWIDKRTKEWEV